MWNLEKWYRWSYLKNRNRDIDIENKWMEEGEGDSGMYEEFGIDMYILLILCVK